MGIYIKLFFAKFYILKMYKKDFYLGLISCIIKALISIFLIGFILDNFEVVGGLESNKVAFIYFFVSFIQAVSNMVLPGIISFTGIYIRDAELDMVLLKPVNKLTYIVFGVLIVFSLCLLINILGFRYKDTLMPIKFLFALVDMCKYPLSIYNSVLRFIFITVIPIGLINYFGVMQMENAAWIFLLGLAVSGVFLFVSVFFFEKAFRLYESTGS